MDAAISTRKYPGYTLVELKVFMAGGRGNDVMAKEIADREAGISKPFVVPQVSYGAAIFKIGRM